MAKKKVVIEVTDRGLKETIADAEKLNRLLDEAAQKSTRIGGGGPSQASPGAEHQKTADGADKAATATDKLNRSQGENYRHSQGVANNSSNLTKNFSKQAQGLGGLIHVYATVAAHAFALSAAFNLLKNAMDTSIVIKGLEEMGSSSGTNLKRMAEGFKEVTGHAISTSQAMRTVSFASSAGMSGKEINNLGKVARGASIGLGRDMADAVDRLTRGVAKLEPEILDELGIIVRVDKASKDYADTLGKTVAQLTVAEKRQAFLNATQEQGLSKWGELSDTIDPNVYDRVAKALEDLTQKSLHFINTVAAPVLEFFSSSPKALMAVMVFMANFIAKKASATWADFGTVMKDKVANASETAAKSLAHMRDELTVLKNVKFDVKKLGIAEGGNILKQYGKDLKISSKVIGGIFNDPNINGEAFVTTLKKRGPQIKSALTKAFAGLASGKKTVKFLGADVARTELKQIEIYLNRLGIITKTTAKEMELSLGGAASVAEARWKVFTSSVLVGLQSIKSAGVTAFAAIGGALNKLLGPISWVMLAWSLFEDKITAFLQKINLMDKGSKEIGELIDTLSEDVKHSTKVLGKYNEAMAEGIDNTAQWTASFKQASNLVRNFSQDYESVSEAIAKTDITNKEDLAKSSKLLAKLITNYKSLNNSQLNSALNEAISAETLQDLKNGNTEVSLIRTTLATLGPVLDSVSEKIKLMGDNFNNFSEALSKMRKAFAEFAKSGLKTTPYDNLTESMLKLESAYGDTAGAAIEARATSLKESLEAYSDTFGVGIENQIQALGVHAKTVQAIRTEIQRVKTEANTHNTNIQTLPGKIEALEAYIEEHSKVVEEYEQGQASLKRVGMDGSIAAQLMVPDEPEGVNIAAYRKAVTDVEKLKSTLEASKKEYHNQLDPLLAKLRIETERLSDAMEGAKAPADKLRETLVANYKEALAAQKDLLQFKFEEKQFAAISKSATAISRKYEAQLKLLDKNIKLTKNEVDLKKELAKAAKKKYGEESVQYAQRNAAYENENEKLRQMEVTQTALKSGAAEYLEFTKLAAEQRAIENKHSLSLLNYQLRREELFTQNDPKRALSLARMKSAVETEKLETKHKEAQAKIQSQIEASMMRQDKLTDEALKAEKERQKYHEDKLKNLKLEHKYEDNLLKLQNKQNELAATGAQDVFDRVQAFKDGIKGGDTLSDDLDAIGEASPIAKRIEDLRTELEVQTSQKEVLDAHKDVMEVIIAREEKRRDILEKQTQFLEKQAQLAAATATATVCPYAAEPSEMIVGSWVVNNESKDNNVSHDLSSRVQNQVGGQWTQLGRDNKIIKMTDTEQEALIKNLVSQITPELAKFYQIRPELHPNKVKNVTGIRAGVYTAPDTKEQKLFEGGASGGKIWVAKMASIMTLIQEQMEVFLDRNAIDFGGEDFAHKLFDSIKGADLPENWLELQQGMYMGDNIGNMPEEVWQRINEMALSSNETWLEAFDSLPINLANTLLEAGVVRDMANAADQFNSGGLGMGTSIGEDYKFTHNMIPDEGEEILMNGQTQSRTSELNQWLVDENKARLDVMLMHWEEYAKRAGAVQFKSMGKAISYITQLSNWDERTRDKDAERRKKFNANFTAEEKKTTAYTEALKKKESQWVAQNQQEKMAAYANTFGAIGSMMEKESKAQQAFFALEKAMHIAKMAMKMEDLAVTLGLLPAKAAEAAADGAAKDPIPYTKIATGMAIFAALSALIGSVGGGGGGATSTKTAATRTQRVASSATLETPTEAADSLTTALENIEEIEIKAFEQGWDVLYTLRSIDNSMAQLSADIIKGLQAMGGIGTFSIGDMETVFGDWFGTTESGHPGYFGGLFGGKSTSRTTELLGAGVKILAQNLSDVFSIDSGDVKELQLKIWEKVKTTSTTTKSGFLGFGGGTSTNTSTEIIEKDFDNAAESSFAKTLYEITHAVIDLGEQMGYARDDLIDTLDGFQIAAQQIDLKDLAPEEQASAINAALSAIANDITLKIIPAVESWRHAGEEYLEALSRVYRDMLGFNQAFETIGRSMSDFFSKTGVTDIIDWQQKLLGSKKGGFGDIGGLKEAFTKFAQSIYSEGELAKFALESAEKRVSTGLSELSLSSSTSADEFRSWYESKLGTGFFDDPDKLAIVIRLGEAFDDMTSSADDLADAFGGIIDLIEEMKYGELSSLTQAQKYAHFKTEAEQLAKDAMAGDVQAGEKLAETMAKFVELSKDMFGGVGNFMNDRDWALQQLEDFKSKMGFAMGGIIAGGFKAFASGGLVSQPTLGLVGEGQYNEAIVPLPDGRNIPVVQTGNNPVVVELSKFREEQAELMKSAVIINSQEGEELREQIEDLKAEIVGLRDSTEGFGNSVERVATNIEYGRA